jgi:hypothetical protein
MTPPLQPRVRKFRREVSYSDEAYATCIIPTVNGAPHGVDMTITQAKALSLELSRAILEYELIDGVDGSVRLAAQWSDVPLDSDLPEPRTRGWSSL